MSPLPGGMDNTVGSHMAREWHVSVPVAVRRVANCCTPFTLPLP